MSNLPQIFENEQIGKIRVFVKDNEPWFVAKDVCNCLEIRNSRDAINNLDSDEKDVGITDTPGGVQNLSIISESGLYSLILRSRKPEARNFKRWVTHDILPSIRKTGSYSVVSQDNQVKIALEELNRKFDQLAIDVQEMKPKAKFYDAVTETKQLYSIGQVAKILKDDGHIIGRNRLFKILRNQNILMLNKEPYQRYINNGMFKMVLNKKNLYVKTVATGKGLQYIKKIIDELK